MSLPGMRQRPTFHIVSDYKRISPDDVKFKMMERDRLAALDDRDATARWLGDPPPHQSALARRATVPEKPR